MSLKDDRYQFGYDLGHDAGYDRALNFETTPIQHNPFNRWTEEHDGWEAGYRVGWDNGNAERETGMYARTLFPDVFQNLLEGRM